MTTPNQGAPDGAFVVGSDFAQGKDEAWVKNQIKTPVINPWAGAQIAWGDVFKKKFDTVAELRDGQNNYHDRLDLLNQVSGHGSCVMGKNWIVPFNTWRQVPFDVQVGPLKRASVNTTSGRLQLRSGGLWRVDVRMNILGYTRQFVWGGIGTPPPPSWWNYFPLKVTLLLEVLDQSGTVLTTREFNAQTGLLALTQLSPIDSLIKPTSVAFSHTFVVDNLTGQDAEAGSSNYLEARLSIYANAVYGLFDTNVCQIYGGTKLSTLTASRWSRDAVNNIVADSVENGGILTG